MLVDPKALQHILQAAGYKYPKSAEDRQFLRMVTGEGLAWAHGMHTLVLFISLTHEPRIAGEDHSRQRKIMNPAFSSTQLKTFIPLFHFRASQVSLYDYPISSQVSHRVKVGTEVGELDRRRCVQRACPQCRKLALAYDA